jgi:ribosomal protein S15P/S13E
MPFARGNMRDHIIEHKNDHEASHGRYVVLQW